MVMPQRNKFSRVVEIYETYSDGKSLEKKCLENVKKCLVAVVVGDKYQINRNCKAFDQIPFSDFFHESYNENKKISPNWISIICRWGVYFTLFHWFAGIARLDILQDASATTKA